MKIPESVRIAGIEYKVVLVPNLNTGVNMAYGHIDFENTVISLSDTFGTEHQKKMHNTVARDITRYTGEQWYGNRKRRSRR